jgi:hypothetical protein
LQKLASQKSCHAPLPFGKKAVKAREKVRGSGFRSWQRTNETCYARRWTPRSQPIERRFSAIESPRVSQRQFQLNPTTMAGFRCLS